MAETGIGAGLLKAILALIGVLLHFILTPTMRKVSLVLASVIFSGVGGLLIHYAALQYGWGDFTSNAFSFGFGFFSCALAVQLSKFNALIAVDNKLAEAVLDRLEKWIRG